MKRDSLMLSPAGQAGTLGTPAFVRVPASPHPTDGAGTSGDRARSAKTGSAEIVQPCPRSPAGTSPAGTRKPSVYGLSPVSPASPTEKTKDAIAARFDREAIEERAAIMVRDGGLYHELAERRPVESLSDQHTRSTLNGGPSEAIRSDTEQQSHRDTRGAQ